MFALLVYLVQNRERVVSRDELIDEIWGGRYVSDSVVSSRIKSARKVLGDDGRTQSFIKTIHGTGFRFVANVQEIDDQPRLRNDQTSEQEAGLGLTVPTEAPPETNSTQITPRHLALLGLFVVAGVAALQFLFTSIRAPIGPLQPVTSISSEPAPGDVRPSPKMGDESIAVLPFEDFSEEGDQSYFADGVAEELLNTLGQVQGLKVTSRTSSFSFRGSEESAGRIAEKLGVRHLLEGSVRKAGETLRITAQLVDAQEDRHVWSDTYERALSAENLFDVQDEIARAISTALQREIVQLQASSHLQTGSIDAYDAYLLGRSLIAQRTAASITKGIEQLNKAVALDPDFAPAHSSLVDAYVLAYTYAGVALENAARPARAHGAMAITLAPKAPEALAAKGRIASIFDGNEVEAISYLERAIDANPNYSAAHRLLGLSHSSLSHVDAAKASFERAQRLDPIAPVIYANLYRTNWDLGDLDTMRALGEENMRLNPDNVFARRVLGGSLRESGQYAAAHRLFKENDGRFNASQDQLSRLYYLIGQADLAAQYEDSFIRAQIALGAGNKQEAIKQKKLLATKKNKRKKTNNKPQTQTKKNKNKKQK
ncbi:MAG: winged helix-turn-helix domain-containing protein, partial [Pseudomonadota bacterium]